MRITVPMVIVNVKMGKMRCPIPDPIFSWYFGIGIYMANVQTQLQFRMVYTCNDIKKHVRYFLQHIFQHQLHTGIVRKKFPPEYNGLLYVPHRIVNPGIVAAVNDDLCGTVGLGQVDGLTVTICCQSPGFPVNGAGKKLVKRGMKDTILHTFAGIADNCIRFRKFIVHKPCGGKLRDFQTNAEMPGSFPGIGSYGG
jgi:hypothetical protein